MRAYDAEREVFRRRTKAMTMADARDLAAKLCAHFGVPPLLVQRNRQGEPNWGSTYWWGARSWYRDGTGRAPRIHLAETAPDWLVCHEVAHHVATCRVDMPAEGRPRNPGHGPAWQRLYVEAVELAISAHYARRLHLAMRRRGLRG